MPETALVEGDSNETSAVPAGAMLAELREQVEAVGNLLQPSALVTDQLVAQLAVMRSEAPDEIRAVLQQVDVGYVALRGVGAVRYVLAGAAGGADGQWQFHEFNVFRFMRHLMAASKNQALEMLAQQVAEQADQEEQEGEAQA